MQEYLPDVLVKELQKYVHAGYIYIPAKSEQHRSWGELSGYRRELERRNKAILAEYHRGVGHRFEYKRYSLMTNYSILDPDITRPYIVPGDDRFERAEEQLEKQNADFSVTDALKLLKSVRQEGIWATRVSFVYSVKRHKVFYVLDNRFEEVKGYQFKYENNQ